MELNRLPCWQNEETKALEISRFEDVLSKHYLITLYAQLIKYPGLKVLFETWKHRLITPYAQLRQSFWKQKRVEQQYENNRTQASCSLDALGREYSI